MAEMQLTHPKYRADIDGLRSVAVLSVVGFHAFPEWIEGGFIGVDIFFVISGFLISMIIFGNLENNSFSILEFYSRRIKRIFPSLILVIASIYALGWFLLFNDEYKELGIHIAGGAGFLSNFILWQGNGYFDSTMETKPLLHLWSLAIEEQYYIFAPIIMMLAWKHRWSFLWLTVAVAIVSFGTNIYFINTTPISAFYLPTARFWELMIGGILAYISLHKTYLLEKKKNLQSVLGISLLGLGLLLINKESAFPGWWSLLPTLGTFFIISAGQQAWFNKTVLSNKAFVWCGLISYPLYLWHWPLLSFARIVGKGMIPPLNIRIVIVILSLFLSWLTLILIEKNIRYSKSTRVTVILITTLAILAFAGYASFNRDGLTFRSVNQGQILFLKDLDNYALPGYSCPPAISKAMPFLSFCLTSSKKEATALLVGDSHAHHLIPGIPDNESTNEWLALGLYGCPPTMGITVNNPNHPKLNCKEKFDKLFRYITLESHAKLVVLPMFGRYVSENYYNADSINKHGAGKNKFKLGDDHTSNKIEALYLGLNNAISLLEGSGKKVIVILDTPELPFLPRGCIPRVKTVVSNGCSVSRAEVDDRQLVMRGIVAKLKEKHPQLLVYDPINVLCDSKKCQATYSNRSYYRDSHHLSFFGSDLIGKDFSRWLVGQSVNSGSEGSNQ